MRSPRIALPKAHLLCLFSHVVLLLALLPVQGLFAQDYTPLVFVNAGGESVDSTWEGDTDAAPSPYLSAGTANIETIKNPPSKDASVPTEVPLAIFETMRLDANQPEPFMTWALGFEGYTEFLVEFHFIEMSRCSVGNRVFDVEINGELVLDDLDVYAEAGNQCNVGITRSVEVLADDSLTISFPLVNGKPSTLAGLQVYGKSQGSSSLAVSPSSIDFGFITLRSTSQQVQVTLTNEGNEDITIDDFQVSEEVFPHAFLVTGTPSSIPAGGSAQFDVQFAPGEFLPPPPPFAPTPVIRINAGGSALVVHDLAWSTDTESSPSPFLDPGSTNIESTPATITLDASVPGGTPTGLFSTKRIDANKVDPIMAWDLPVTAGEEYEVNLYFVEMSRCSEANRVFDIEIEGVLVQEALDIYAEAGGCNIGIMKTFAVTATDNNLDLDFPLNNGKPSVLAAIEVLSLESDEETTEEISGQLTIQHSGTNGDLIVDLVGTTNLEGFTIMPPIANFSYTTSELTVNFTDASTGVDGFVYAWSWDLGDGNTSTSENPSHTYLEGGDYEVTLTVTDINGLSGSVTKTVSVSGPVSEELTVSLPSLLKAQGLTELVPVSVTDITGEHFEAYQFTITYDPAVIDIIGVDTTSTLSTEGIILANTTVPGQISGSWANLAPLSGSGTLFNLEVTTIAPGTSPLTFATFMFNEGATPTATDDGSIEVVGSSGDGAFLEVDGLLVMEAENAHFNLSKDEFNDHAWVEATEVSGFSGSSYMEATPDVGEVFRTDELNESPELQFEVEFTTTGLYNFWANMAAFSHKSNVIHVGINGELHDISSTISSIHDGKWYWTTRYHHGTKNQFEITEPGTYTINVWIRSDGVLFDKILFTNNYDYRPTGEGPPESPRATTAPLSERKGSELSKGITSDEVLPTEFALEGNYPNPFNPTTTIQFDVPESSGVRLEVYDMMGRRVATLVDGSYSAGRHQVQWNATNDAGERVASGIYIYRMQAGEFESVNKMILMK